MQLCIKQRVFSWGDTYDIYDETGEARYYVKAEVFTLGHQIHVYDKRNDRQIGAIHQKLFTFLPQFEIVIDGRVVGTIRREFSWFRPRYQVDFQGWQVEGDLMQWDYTVYQGDRTVMTISKELFRWGDTYVMNYQSLADEIPGLLLVIAIDAANCGKD